MEKHTGARALRAILEEYMLDIMYEIPKDDSIGQVIITKEYIKHTGGPRILFKRAGASYVRSEFINVKKYLEQKLKIPLAGRYLTEGF